MANNLLAIMMLCVAADSEDEMTSKPTEEKSDETLLTMANGIRPNLILPSVAADNPAGVEISSTETPFTSGVCKLRLRCWTCINTKPKQLHNLRISAVANYYRSRQAQLSLQRFSGSLLCGGSKSNVASARVI